MYITDPFHTPYLHTSTLKNTHTHSPFKHIYNKDTYAHSPIYIPSLTVLKTHLLAFKVLV